MKNVKILDCTLRDGGYVNEWEFGSKDISKILQNLFASNVDIIECGFMTEASYNKDKTLFNTLEDINSILPKNADKSKIMAMIDFEKFSIDNIPNYKKEFISGFRVIFKKPQMLEALDYCMKIKKKGYKLLINPTFINQYSDIELLNLITEVNKINPYGFSIVDSMGIMKKNELINIFNLIDKNLNKNTAICFHSHNNLQLSFSNAQELLNQSTQRELIIDSCVFGMGRGAGNLCTELLIQYVNENIGNKYNIIPILKIVDEQLNKIFAKTPWGYSVPYYLAAVNHCHPNYASFLVDKQTISVDIINSILANIPNQKKETYDKDLINQMYLNFQQHYIDDSEAVEKLKNLLANKKILMLASGKSIVNQKSVIDNFIKTNKPIVVSLNFIPQDYKSEIAFISNLKRFSNIENFNENIVVTSNITEPPRNSLVLNYSSYLNSSRMSDNVALMFLKLLVKNGVKEVFVAGLDGFSNNPSENYYKDDLINNAKVNEFDIRNKVMTEELDAFSKHIKINYLTKSIYNNKDAEKFKK